MAVNIGGNLSGAWLLFKGVPRWSLIVTANATMGVTAALILGPFAPEAAKIPLAIVFSLVSGVLPAAVIAGAAAHAPNPHLVAMASGFAIQGCAIGIDRPAAHCHRGRRRGELGASLVGDAICPALGLGIAARVWGMERGDN